MYKRIFNNYSLEAINQNQ